MKIAVLSLTRDRREYTRHCFATLTKYAGCDFDHYLLDQGSDVGPDNIASFAGCVLLDRNIGISRGMNVLLEIIDGEGYDVVVKVDNDCELTKPDTLKVVAQMALEGNALVSPRILGLENPPPAIGEGKIGDEPFEHVAQIGGIFMAAPAHVYDEFRFNPSNPSYGGDDVEICRWWRSQGGVCGYATRFSANHYETSVGQRETYPSYWERKKLEMGLA